MSEIIFLHLKCITRQNRTERIIAYSVEWKYVRPTRVCEGQSVCMYVFLRS